MAKLLRVSRSGPGQPIRLRQFYEVRIVEVSIQIAALVPFALNVPDGAIGGIIVHNGDELEVIAGSGGQLLTARYYRRIGRTWRPLDVPRFNGREWTILTVLAIVGLTFIALAIAPSKS